VREAPGRLLEWFHHVEVPHSKRPRDGMVWSACTGR
jgi:hypothetical protein